jgi:hypothetical protein
MKGKSGYSIGPVRGLQNLFGNRDAEWICLEGAVDQRADRP